jgi:hypothetical protein
VDTDERARARRGRTGRKNTQLGAIRFVSVGA